MFDFYLWLPHIEAVLVINERSEQNSQIKIKYVHKRQMHNFMTYGK